MPYKNALAEVDTINVGTWDELLKQTKSLKNGWTFRGLSQDWPLKTSLDRACDNFEIENEFRPKIERELIRDFQRKYKGDDSNLVVRDVAYCLSLMQHYGAPTRFLDATYSFYTAIFFALEFSIVPTAKLHDSKLPVVWCINGGWLGKQAVKNDKSNKLKIDRTDNKRGTKIFEKIYMRIKRRSKFVYKENPLKLNDRAIVQQSVFWCPADVSLPFAQNLASMKGWQNDRSKVTKFRLVFSQEERKQAFRELQRMNITHASLFPGMEGFSRGFRLNLPLYVNISEGRKGKLPSETAHLPL